MTRRLCLLAIGSCLLTSPAPAQSGYIDTVQGTPNLVAYWRFDSGNPTGSQVNGYSGTFNNGAALGANGSGPAFAADPNNQSLELDGANDYFTTTLTGAVSSAGSIAAWVYPAVAPSAAGHYFHIAALDQGGNDFGLVILTDDTTRFYTGAGTNSFYPTALPVGQWTFVAATFTADVGQTLYINGVAVDSDTAGSHVLSSNFFTIGASDVFPNRFFQGAIDEVAVFNRELTSGEIAGIYASASAIPEPGTMALLAGGAALLLALGKRKRPTGLRSA